MSNHCGNCIWEAGKADACKMCIRNPETGDCTHWSGGTVIEQPKPNPKQAAGDLKDPLDLLPTVALREEAKVLKSGADKYGKYNWRASDALLIMTYVAAIMRHLFLFVDGQDKDEESGLCHLAHIRACCAILMDARRVGNLTDDRPKLAEEYNGKGK